MTTPSGRHHGRSQSPSLASKAAWSFERSPPEPSRPVPAVPSVSRRARSGVSHEWDPTPCGPCVGLLSTCQARGFHGACPCRPGWVCLVLSVPQPADVGSFLPSGCREPCERPPRFFRGRGRSLLSGTDLGVGSWDRVAALCPLLPPSASVITLPCPAPGRPEEPLRSYGDPGTA